MGGLSRQPRCRMWGSVPSPRLPVVIPAKAGIQWVAYTKRKKKPFALSAAKGLVRGQTLRCAQGDRTQPNSIVT